MDETSVVIYTKDNMNYRQRKGCWNCRNVDRTKIASGIYPICNKLNNFVDNWCICDEWQKESER